MRILAVGIMDDGHNTGVLDSNTGQMHSVGYLHGLVNEGEGILVGSHLYTQVAELHAFYRDFPNWIVQIRGINKTIIRLDREITVGNFLPLFFGFRSGHKGGRLYHCMDLHHIAGKSVVTVHESMEYAKSILELCEDRGVKFSGTRGGLAAKFLKASPNWETKRHAAPEFVNSIARERLPGNHYGLGADKNRIISRATYLDQVSSHHTVASQVGIPHPNHIRAQGHYQLALAGTARQWIPERNSKEYVENHYGLFACWVYVAGGRVPDYLKPKWLQGSPGHRLVYLYHNEFEYLDNYDCHLVYIAAAWVSDKRDEAIPEYAKWALDARNRGIGRKQLLLSAYGVLAQRTDQKSTVYSAWRGVGERHTLPTAGDVKITERERKPYQAEPSTVSVLSRGIIEAETRRRSLFFARELMEQYNARILSVYVDGLIVQCDQLPLLPPEWRIESELTNLKFHHPTSFEAIEMRKTPGVPHDSIGRAAVRMATARARDLARSA